MSKIKLTDDVIISKESLEQPKFLSTSNLLVDYYSAYEFTQVNWTATQDCWVETATPGSDWATINSIGIYKAQSGYVAGWFYAKKGQAVHGYQTTRFGIHFRAYGIE